MNDLFVSFLTTLFVFAIIKLSGKKESKKIKYRQSHINSIIGPFIPSYIANNVIKKTQSLKHYISNIIDVLVTENYAYWVHENVFYRAVVEDGRVDRTTTSPIDIQNMSNEDVNKMMVILDKLKNRAKNENRGTGNK